MTRPIELTRGNVYRHTLRFSEPVAGQPWLAQIRKAAKSEDVLVTFTVDDSNAAADPPEVVLTLTAEQTRGLPDVCAWDVLTDFGDGQVTLFANSPVRTSPKVSRSA